jgi:hypothetical protein
MIDVLEQVFSLWYRIFQCLLLFVLFINLSEFTSLENSSELNHFTVYRNFKLFVSVI